MRACADNSLAALAQKPVSVLCGAHADVQAMSPAIRPLYAGATLFGPAKTVRTAPGENAAVHRAVHSAKAGDILVVDARGERNFGLFGDILAACCSNQGVLGAVIDGAVRDSAEIAKMQFPVFCVGVHPAPTAKSHAGSIDVEVRCGGVLVRPGDFIAGDDDGVAVIPHDVIKAVADNAGAIIRKEEAVRARLAKGETTCDIFGIPA